MAAVNMDAHQALCRLYSISFSLDELAQITESSTEKSLASTLNLLHQCSEEALHVINPLIPQPIRRRPELDEE